MSLFRRETCDPIKMNTLAGVLTLRQFSYHKVPWNGTGTWRRY